MNFPMWKGICRFVWVGICMKLYVPLELLIRPEPKISFVKPLFFYFFLVPGTGFHNVPEHLFLVCLNAYFIIVSKLYLFPPVQQYAIFFIVSFIVCMVQNFRGKKNPIKSLLKTWVPFMEEGQRTLQGWSWISLYIIFKTSLAKPWMPLVLLIHYKHSSRNNFTSIKYARQNITSNKTESWFCATSLEETNKKFLLIPLWDYSPNNLHKKLISNKLKF